MTDDDRTVMILRFDNFGHGYEQKAVPVLEEVTARPRRQAFDPAYGLLMGLSSTFKNPKQAWNGSHASYAEHKTSERS